MAKVSILFSRISMLAVFSLVLGGVSCNKNLTDFQPLPTRQPETVVAVDGGATSSDLTPAEVRQLLQEHNRVRAEVGVGALVWSESIAAHARQWAEYLAASGCRMEHRPVKGPWRGVYGENLFMGTAGHYGVVDAVRGWESEKRFFEGGPFDVIELATGRSLHSAGLAEYPGIWLRKGAMSGPDHHCL